MSDRREALRLSLIGKTAALTRNSECVAEAKKRFENFERKNPYQVVSEDRENNRRLDYQHRRVSVG
jgi:putative heme degradation protein